jgi:trans-2,3-dihydro-3-hydroxyanthranilate isomerase
MSERLKFITADVFTTTAYGGNPLAVVLNGERLTGAQMQIVAREFNLSETTFILPPQATDHAARVRIFTPNTELPFAGHPTVGTAWVMAQLGLITPSAESARVTFEEGVGLIPLVIDFDGAQPRFVWFTTAIVPEVLAPPPSADILAALVGLQATDLREGTPPLSLTCGTPYTCIPLKTSAGVQRAALNSGLWQQHLAATSAHKVYVFARPEQGIVHARMFAPGEGVAEDPATGSAACALAEWLVRDDAIVNGTACWTIRQGAEIGRPSEIMIEADVRAGRIVAVRCGGTAVLMAEGTLHLPAEARP